MGLPVPAAALREQGLGHSHDADPAHGHDHDHPHGHGHDHPHAPPEAHGDERRTVAVHEAVLARNDRQAERNRGYFKAKGLLVVNVLSSPGSGKTALIERTLKDFGDRVRVGVIVGDLQTDHDALRLREAGAPAVQVTTGDVCHLDAEMVARAAERLDLDALDLLIIENVGNLVCPAAYDLGEDLRVVLLSVTEGEDKPLKYPLAFRTAQVVVINKADIADAAGFDRERALENLRRVAPGAILIEVSARTGQGMDGWYGYLEGQRSARS
ncbi:MAG: hydrogenase accessory protein HypB [Candidatus Handelsmanbacteria bacterium RIFCSPLOWO2_12_FULL_64_10]|uniref:Hydrogenase accessory protein HypB n=1 Tax=Handelsmanbacteria sp. (strain RIFCSPLOWO2_12_FULL_64_10) TaxID=1817868 RepID=A0A1F6C6D3_HANXR|nr:MAG: hydrogenase accessory protein HypB [Candidatus Handelsmanbacteria bacterium RIFCSPLOWO2_12_FULL_64_10]